MTSKLPFLLLFLLACGDDSTPADGGRPDANTDAGAPDDGAPDATPADGGSDMGADGGGPDDIWAWCPGADSYAGDDSWTDRLEVPDLVWCVAGNENRPLREDRAQKRQLRLIAGSYPYPPMEDATGALSLPFCTRSADGEGPSADGSGMYSVAVSEFDAIFNLRTSLDDDSEFVLSMISEDRGEGLVWPSAPVDGSLTGGLGSAGSLSLGGGLAPCEGMDSWGEARASAVFEGGELQITYRAVPGSVSTGPSGGFHATGTLDGTAFDVRDYFRIFYEAGHHHVGGEFAVLFDAPIRDACGIRLTAFSGSRSVALVDCDLEELEELMASEIIGPNQ